jgi:D-3-phosphoglycerate dehydrogenase
MSVLNKVLIAAPVHGVLLDMLQKSGFQCIVRESINQSQAYDIIVDCVGVITSTRLQLDEALLTAARQLRWIGRMGSGMEVIDVSFARSRGVYCFASPEGNCNAVGEHALGMLLSLIRRIPHSNRELEQGIWKREENRGIELEGKTVGIIGFGHAGAAFARRLAGFDVNIIAYDKYAPEKIPAHVKNCSSVDGVLAEADVLSFHVPLQADTEHYFDAAMAASIKRPILLVNTSRGKVVSMKALYDALERGAVAGACLDVFESEPISALDAALKPLFERMTHMDNVVMTPHIAGYTHEALYKMSRTLAEKLAAHLSQMPPLA